MFSLVANPPLMRPALGTMKKAGKRTLGSMGSTITSSQSTLETIGAALDWDVATVEVQAAGFADEARAEGIVVSA